MSAKSVGAQGSHAVLFGKRAAEGNRRVRGRLFRSSPRMDVPRGARTSLRGMSVLPQAVAFVTAALMMATTRMSSSPPATD